MLFGNHCCNQIHVPGCVSSHTCISCHVCILECGVTLYYSICAPCSVCCFVVRYVIIIIVVHQGACPPPPGGGNHLQQKMRRLCKPSRGMLAFQRHRALAWILWELRSIPTMALRCTFTSTWSPFCAWCGRLRICLIFCFYFKITLPARCSVRLGRSGTWYVPTAPTHEQFSFFPFQRATFLFGKELDSVEEERVENEVFKIVCCTLPQISDWELQPWFFFC